MSKIAGILLVKHIKKRTFKIEGFDDKEQFLKFPHLHGSQIQAFVDENQYYRAWGVDGLPANFTKKEKERIAGLIFAKIKGNQVIVFKEDSSNPAGFVEVNFLVERKNRNGVKIITNVFAEITRKKRELLQKKRIELKNKEKRRKQLLKISGEVSADFLKELKGIKKEISSLVSSIGKTAQRAIKEAKRQAHLREEELKKEQALREQQEESLDVGGLVLRGVFAGSVFWALGQIFS
jgi:hypothetical protein